MACMVKLKALKHAKEGLLVGFLILSLFQMKGDEVSLQKALAIVHWNSQAYVAVLFYASWCPFSRVFSPIFSILSSLFPSICHFAIEESSVRPRLVHL